MYRSILLPLDGSSFAEEAVPLAALLARDFDSDLHLVHVIRPIPDMDFKTPTDDMDWKEGLREAASGVLGEMAAELRKDGVRAKAEIREGRAVEALLEAVVDSKVDLVVLTSHGAGGFRRWWLGSVADSLIRTSHVPTLLVRPWDDTEDHPPEDGPRFRTIVVPLDGSAEAERAIPHARALQLREGGQIVLVRVVPSPLEVGSLYGFSAVRFERDSHREHREEAGEYLDQVISREFSAEGSGEQAAASREGSGDSAAAVATAERRIMEATGAAEGILEAVRVTGADLIVLASSGRGGFTRTVLGSVADKVIRGAASAVLVVPPEEE